MLLKHTLNKMNKETKVQVSDTTMLNNDKKPVTKKAPGQGGSFLRKYLIFIVFLLFRCH
jgi:hypothetical protein